MCKCSKTVASNPTLPPDANRITTVGKVGLHNSLRHRPPRRVPKRKWHTNSKPKLAKRSMRLRKETVEPVIGIIKEVLGLSPILVARFVGGDGRMVSGVFGLQSEALAYLASRLNAGGAATRLHTEKWAEVR